jgi:glutamyl-tRNA reductase
VNLVVVGISHHTTPVDLLERVAVGPGQTTAVLAQLVAGPHVNEAVVLSTCNRVEVYAGVTAFHGGLSEIGAVLADRAGLPVTEFARHLYVRDGADAAAHALRVAAGLDSVVIGEAQILGQLRDAYGVAAEAEMTGRLLHELMQQALRVGKRVHTETGIDGAGQSVVSAALDLVPGGVVGRSALVVGAGSMGALTLATLARAGAGPLLIANRGVARATRVAGGHGATPVPLEDLAALVSDVDLVVCATASPEPVLTADMVAGRGRPLTILDLAVPRDVAHEVGTLPGVTLIDMDRVAAARLAQPSAVQRAAAEAIVAAEAEAFRVWLRGADVAPTVAALRARADEVVGVELRRLAQRRPDLSDEQRAEVARTVHRVVQRLLHSPTVRVREFAGTAGGEQYVTVLRELFDLTVPSADLRHALDVEVELEIESEREVGS